MLFWSFCLLTFVQCVAGMILSTLCADFINDAGRFSVALCNLIMLRHFLARAYMVCAWPSRQA